MPIDRRLVSVIGSSDAQPDEPAYQYAFEVGKRLSEAGINIICGGRGGVMEAVCKGAQEGNGITIGILPSTDYKEANPYVTYLLPTDLGGAGNPKSRSPEISRNRVIASAGTCVIAVGGGTGTANEIMHATRFGKKVLGIANAPDEGRPPSDEERNRTGSYEKVDEDLEETMESVITFVKDAHHP